MANPMAATAQWSAKHPFLAIALTLLVAFGTAAGMSQAEEGRISELFVPDDLPALQVQRDIEDIWGESEAAFFLYLTDDPTDAQLLRAVHADIDRAAALPDIDSAQGLTTLIEAQAGPIENLNDAQLTGAAQQLLGSPAGKPFIVEDALAVRVVFPPAEDVTAMADQLRGITAASEAPSHGADVRTAGILFVEEWQAENAGGDVMFLMPLSLVVILIVLGVLFRRFQDVAIPVVTVLLAVMMAYGTVAWAGFALAPPSFIVMPLLLGLGIDYMLHIIYAYRERPQSERQHERFRAMGHQVGLPVFFTAATTLIGFGSFLVSNIPQIRTWGLLIGSGALYAFLLGFTLLPALYRMRRKKPRNVRLPLGDVMHKVTDAALHKRGLTLAIFGLITVGLAVSAAFVDVKNDIEFEPEDDVPVIMDLNAVQDRFGGQLLTLFLVDATNREDLESFEKALAASPHAGFVDGPIHRLERAGDPDGSLVGPATEGVATGSHWLVTVGYLFEEQDDALDSFEAIADASPLEIGMTGQGVMEQESQAVFLPTLAKSTGIALVLVIALLLIVFRRPGVAGLAFLPLVLTVVWQLGLQNLLGIPINPITGVMTAMIIGVGVDYSLHIMAHFVEERRAGRSPLEAADAAMRSVGRPVLAASLTTVFAFSVLGFSSLEPLRDFGIVAALAVASAFMVSLTILPVLASWLPAGRTISKPAAAAAHAGTTPARLPRARRDYVMLEPTRPRFSDPDVAAWHAQERPED